MTIAETVIQKVLSLPPEKQVKVLEFVEKFEPQSLPRTRTPRGTAGEFRFHISDDEWAALRREMWGTSTDHELD